VPSKLSKIAVVDGVFLGYLVNAANHLLLYKLLAPKSSFGPQLCFSCLPTCVSSSLTDPPNMCCEQGTVVTVSATDLLDYTRTLLRIYYAVTRTFSALVFWLVLIIFQRKAEHAALRQPCRQR
jgi:hypothetical protein